MPLHTRVLDRKVLYPGDVLIREGDYGDCAYLVQSGQLGVYKQAGGEEVLITVLPSNAIVGEMALIDNHRRSATVRCLETATVVTISRAFFEQKLEQLDPLMRAMLEMFSQKLRRLNQDYCDTDVKLQWLLRQTGLPRLPQKTRWVRQVAEPTQTPPAEAAPSPPPATQAAAVEAIDRFDRLKLMLARLYHPDCINERASETLTRIDVFTEIWGALQTIEEDGDGPTTL